MAAPTNAANVKKALANSEPSTHGTKRTSRHVRACKSVVAVLICYLGLPNNVWTSSILAQRVGCAAVKLL
jgi:hypothetical protein